MGLELLQLWHWPPFASPLVTSQPLPGGDPGIRIFSLGMGCDGNQTRPEEQTMSYIDWISGGAVILLLLVSPVVSVLLRTLDDDHSGAGCDSGFGESEKCHISIY